MSNSVTRDEVEEVTAMKNQNSVNEEQSLAGERHLSPSPALATYPEMNRQIVSLLRLGGSALSLYAAARIEELEDALNGLRASRVRRDSEPCWCPLNHATELTTVEETGEHDVACAAARAALKEKGSESQ